MTEKTKKILKYTLLTFSALIGVLLLFTSSVYLGAWGKIPNDLAIKRLAKFTPSEVYDRNGKLITTFTQYNRKPISFKDIPPHVINALIATEDVRFLKHSGVDYKSLGRVLIKSILLSNDRAGGGSTLSQQIAKNLFNREDYGMLSIPVAKTKEMFTARRIEDLYTKDELLELYLNIVPFAGNTYGIESASQKFFNKSTGELTIAEAATLIGTLKATSYYNPEVHPKRSKKRRNVVLSQMKKYGFLEDELYECTVEEKFHLQFGLKDNKVGVAPHFLSKLERRLLDWCRLNSVNGRDYDLYASGLKVYTTIDLKMQQLAEEAAKEHMKVLQGQFEKEYAWGAPWRDQDPIFKSYVTALPKYISLRKKGLGHKDILDTLSRKRTMIISTYDKEQEVNYSTIDSLRHQLKQLNLGTLAINPSNGAINVWLGGLNYDSFKYDHMDGKRQVGSTFKPIVYAAALERGVDPCEYISGKEVIYENLDNWSPSNGNQSKHDSLQYSMTGALTNSLNAISVKILERTGIDRVVSLARALNINSELPKVPSIALGTAELTITEMAGAYAAFVNMGKPVEPYYLERIENAEGYMMQRFGPKEGKDKALRADTREAMVHMLKSVANYGTGSRLRYKYRLDNDIGGKTGTTQDNKDAWFVGVMPELVTVTWVGHDDHRIGFRSTRVGQGANAALPVTALLLQKMNKDTLFNKITKARFPQINERVIAKLDCPNSILEERKFGGFWSFLFKREKDTIEVERRDYIYDM
ncbi:transglycosylase domain-containing protein [Dokdonia sp. Hel_I_53]|uniref:transglycosylase domain-containing protein n=1 Tax=Dokdonia sp. Hel_I_53 TaxID=1566287 RepID=UPI00119BD8FD|nr:transglycosylase domain-containing protein [Dokdonia sp. Hel_I_53]TVZ53124.1 penicillin-binding protein 1A [Dokdonia sp. Hel_I_53]